MYSEALDMRPSVSYILYATSSYEQTGYIITSAEFEEGNLVEKGRNSEEDKYILASIDESYTDNDSYDRYISTNALGDIRDGSQIHPEISARYAR